MKMLLVTTTLLFMAGFASGTAVVNGTNTCLDPDIYDYRCSMNPGVLTIDMEGCGITDADLTDLEKCFADGDLRDFLGNPLPIAFIKLGQNDLTELPKSIFEPFASTLTELHLEGNRLEQLPGDIFAGMSSLLRLNLEENSLSALPSGLFDGLGQLTFLYLLANPALQCLPSTAGTSLVPAHIYLPTSFPEDPECGCPAGGCDSGCQPGTEGYICTGGSTPAPATPAPGTPAPGTPATGTPAPGTPAPGTPAPGTPAPGTPAPGTPAPGTPSSGTPGSSTPAPSTPAPSTPAPPTAGETSSGTTCKNGLPGLQVGDACCVQRCRACGGVNCSQFAEEDGLTAAECCVNTIIATGVECGGVDNVTAPCVNYETLAPVPAPTDGTPPGALTTPPMFETTSDRSEAGRLLSPPSMGRGSGLVSTVVMMAFISAVVVAILG